MSPERNDIEAIYSEARSRTGEAERSGYLESACAGDPRLRARVEALLKAHDRAGQFLETPPPFVEVPILKEAVTEQPGTIIGRYKLLEKIGEGGMAVVYMAEQQEPIRRKVALKIIKLGMDTRQVIARFEAERQALALMDHPSIAKVLDAGATETGRPYFVMELVPGVSITEYCDRNNLSTKDRLALFLQVCHAVQHAHQKGIIHRDIKPSNVMVTHHDGKPVPKVIDFGIAKATNQRLTEKTLFTRYAHLIGTPAYMSPEQAELSDLDIDTRSDIYSLGVLLYELLTGTTPFSEEELRKAGYVEMQRVIREQEPVKPSTKLSTLGETLAEVAKLRNATPDLLRKAIRGDLDWIVMKSLEKDRARRYETASGLGEDVRRHLGYEPILAKGPSARYVLGKFVRRHRTQTIVLLGAATFAGAAIIVLAMWNQDRLRLAQAESLSHRAIFYQALGEFTSGKAAAARGTIESVLDSRHVGREARSLHNRILDSAREQVGQYTAQIEDAPEEAKNYFARAQYYDCLRDRSSANADMVQWSTLMSQGWFPDSGPGTPGHPTYTIDVAFAYQLVFSAKRGQNGIPILCIALGQKGRGSMRSFEIPMLAMSLVGLGLLSGLTAPPAHADFAFGTPTTVEGIEAPNREWLYLVGCFSSDGLEMYLSSGPADLADCDIFVLKRASQADTWGPPENLGTTVNSTKVDAVGSISADGLTLYFNSNRPGGYGGMDIWMTTRATRDHPWGFPVNLGPTINSSADDGGPLLAPTGLELYFASWRKGGYGSSDLYVARRPTSTSVWGPAENLGPVVNSPGSECNQSLSPDGLLMVFSGNMGNPVRPGGYGNMDIWLTTRATISASWASPRNLGPVINSSSHDQVPLFSPEGDTLYFHSNRPAGSAMFFGGLYQAPILPLVDFNGDGKVDATDQGILKAHLGPKQANTPSLRGHIRRWELSTYPPRLRRSAA